MATIVPMAVNVLPVLAILTVPVSVWCHLRMRRQWSLIGVSLSFCPWDSQWKCQQMKRGKHFQQKEMNWIERHALRGLKAFNAFRRTFNGADWVCALSSAIQMSSRPTMKQSKHCWEMKMLYSNSACNAMAASDISRERDELWRLESLTNMAV